MAPYFHDFEISPELKECGVSRMAQEGTTFLIQFNGTSSSIRFDIDLKSWNNTVAAYHEYAKRLITDEDLRYKIENYLADQYIKFLGNGNGHGRTGDDEYEDYAAKLIKSYTLKTLIDTDEIWYYDSERGIFVPNAEPIIKHRIELDKGMPFIDENGKIHESDLTIRDVDEYIAHIQRRTPTSREDFNPSIEWLGCNNCMLNVKTGETQPFSPDFMNTTHIQVNYIKYNLLHNVYLMETLIDIQN